MSAIPPPADRPMSLERVRRSRQSQGPDGQILNLGMLFLAKCTVRINLLCNGLVHLSVTTLGVKPPMCRAARQQEEFTDENHRCNRIVRFCSQDG
jgi:hypothetical protein